MGVSSGEIAAARRASLKEAGRLRNQNTQLLAQRNEPIAIVGIGCRYPGGVSSAQGVWDVPPPRRGRGGAGSRGSGGGGGAPRAGARGRGGPPPPGGRGGGRRFAGPPGVGPRGPLRPRSRQAAQQLRP